MPTFPAIAPPVVTGLIATYFGKLGVTARYYWVRANYPDGQSALSGPALATTFATLSNADQVLLTWSPMPGAISYDVLQTTTSTLPTVSASILNAAGVTANSYTDQGDTLGTYIPFPSGNITGSGIKVAHFKFDFAVDGGAISTITPVQTCQIPKNAIIIGATLNSTTAFAGASGTVAVGVSAGGAVDTIKTATAITSFSTDAVVNGTATLAAPVKLTAAGNVTLTIATTAQTAGVMEGWVYYVGPATAA